MADNSANTTSNAEIRQTDKEIADEKIAQLQNELASISEETSPAVFRLVQGEIFRLRGNITEFVELKESKRVKLRAKVNIPATEGRTNYVGKLLGPRGSTLRALSESTNSKMTILGKGSLRDESKEVELMNSGDSKYYHLKGQLHLQVDVVAPATEAYYRMSHALDAVQKCFYETENGADRKAGQSGSWSADSTYPLSSNGFGMADPYASLYGGSDMSATPMGYGASAMDFGMGYEQSWSQGKAPRGGMSSSRGNDRPYGRGGANNRGGNRGAQRGGRGRGRG